MSINYNCFDFETADMKTITLDFFNLIQCLPVDRKCRVNTNIKTHCFDENDKEFIINVNKGKISNNEIFTEINEYLRKNNARSFFFEAIVSRGNGNYELMWSS
jgi:hypothetical protein